MKVWHIAIKKVVKIDLPDWAKVHGPIGTVIANLVRIGWQPHEPGLWLDETGDAWECNNFQKHLDWSALEAKIQDSCRKTLDNLAAEHRFGRGFEEGVDFTVLCKHLETLGKNKGFGGDRP